MKTGKVKFINSVKGWGFIIIDNSLKEVFFHVTQVLGKVPAEGTLVSFETEETKRGKAAINVRII